RLAGLLEILRQAGRGLAAAHAADMVHRDFKPANVIVGADGRVRVVDFGLARVHAGVTSIVRDELVATFREDALRSSSGDSQRSPASGLEAEVTAAGTFVGTPRYMAPEQFSGKPVDPRADQFSFCTVLFEGVFGRSPWTGANVAKIHAEMLDGPPKLPSDDAVPPWLRAALRRGLSPRVGQRFASIETLLDAITPPAESLRERGTARWLGLAGISAVALAASWLWLRPVPVAENPCEGVGDWVDEVWNDAARAEIAASFRATGVPYAETAVEGVVADIDGYTQRWSDAATSACLRGEQGDWAGSPIARAQSSCLELRLAELGQVVSLLADADAEAVESALDSSGALVPASWCERLSGDERLDDPAILELRLRLARAKSMGRTGARAEAMAAAWLIADDADRHGATDIRADVLLLLGKLTDNKSSATALFEKAFLLALSAADDEVALAAAIALVEWSSDETSRNHWRRHAGALLQRGRAGSEDHAELALALGRAADRHGQSTLAQHYLRAALAAMAPTRRRDPLLESRIWFALAVSSARADPGEFDDTAFAIAMETVRDRFGASHPRVAQLETAWGTAGAARSDNAGAVLHLERAVAIFSSLPGPMTSSEIEARRDLGEVLALTGRRDAGFHQLLRAHDGLADATGLSAAFVDRSIGWALLIDGRPQDAIVMLSRAYEVERRIRGEGHSDLSVVLNRLAIAYETVDDLPRALRATRRAAELLSSAHEYASGALALANLSVLTGKIGDHRMALTYARRAVELQTRGRVLDSRLCFPLRLMGLQLLTLGRAGEATVPLERALALHSVGSFDTHERPKTQLALARALWSSGGDRRRAHGLATSARDTLAREDPDSVELVETEAWLREHSMPSGGEI
ncbi:MAG: serine/threonine protein kinase, partial [Deltaproteobacteria bacterium]|nr:serine/threonine protein kinase [Nannocystaceae bacterium]